MEKNQTLLEVVKAAITTSLTDTLSPAQANKFISTVVKMSDFLGMISVDKNIKTSLVLSSIGLANRALRKATEATAPTDLVGATTTKRSLIPVEVILPYDLSFSWLEANVEGPDAENKINDAFATLFANDLVDLIFNADGTTSGFLEIITGLLTTAQADSAAHPFTRNETRDWKGTVFPALFTNLPDKFKGDRKSLAYFTSYKVEQEYRQSLADRVTALGDAYLTEARSAQFMGVDVVPVPNVPDGAVFLTQRQNIHLGFGRDMRVGKFVNERARTLEYTITAKIDADYALSDAVSYCI